jgi:cytoskeletal protein RodZ
VTHTLRLVDPLNDRADLAPGDFQSTGAYLRAVRERHGRSIAELAATTRIRKAYLAAIEDGDYSALPSRPFAIGYVRAYAAALELDGEAAAERFKQDMPDASEPLRAPIGVKHEKPERRPLFFAIAAVVVALVVGWNIVQRALTVEPEQAPPPLPAPVADAPAVQGPISLGAPTPPPAEQTTPAPYVTPGLAPADPAADPNAPAAKPEAVIAAAPAPQVFSSRAAVYGSVADGPAVVLQARKAASLIVRGAAGEVYFARQLALGEAYRAPVGRKLQVDVTDPGAFAVYINGQLQGSLTLPQTPIDKVAAEIVRAAPVAPRPAAAPAAAAPAAPATPRPSVPRPAAQAAAPAPAPAAVPAPPPASAPAAAPAQ